MKRRTVSILLSGLVVVSMVSCSKGETELSESSDTSSPTSSAQQTQNESTENDENITADQLSLTGAKNTKASNDTGTTYATQEELYEIFEQAYKIGQEVADPSMDKEQQILLEYSMIEGLLIGAGKEVEDGTLDKAVYTAWRDSAHPDQQSQQSDGKTTTSTSSSSSNKSGSSSGGKSSGGGSSGGGGSTGKSSGGSSGDSVPGYEGIDEDDWADPDTRTPEQIQKDIEAGEEAYKRLGDVLH